MISFDELKRMAEKDPVKEIYPDEAMHRLSPTFARLKNCKDGKAFLEEVEIVFRQMGCDPFDSERVSVHTIIGICQLAHHIRDEVSPSRRKSFNKIIPWLLKHRDKIKKKPPKDIIQYMVQEFDALQKKQFG